MFEKVLKTNRKIALLIVDVLIFLAVYFGVYLFEIITAKMLGEPERLFWIKGIFNVINFAVLFFSVFVLRFVFQVYENVWRYAMYSGYLRLILADFFGGVLGLSVLYLILKDIDVLQITVIVAGQLIAAVFARCCYQYIRGIRIFKSQKDFEYVAIVGAGNVGISLVKELKESKNAIYRPWCFIDTDKEKIGRMIYDIKTLDENSEGLIAQLKSGPVKEIIIAIPTEEKAKIDQIYEKYSSNGFKVRIYDFAEGMIDDKFNRERKLREIKIEDLLFREQVGISENDIEFYRGKTVLVTGGGGSIGSEICRQLATMQLKKLIIFDIYENNAYDIQQELSIKYGNTLDLSVEIGSVRDRKRLDELFAKYRPDMVFHAAAHKHVPLMEESAGETIKNNVLGTYNTADMAEKYGVKKFVLISTDKAVNPTNIMGASKRMCEMIIQARTDSATAFSAVRFGNVLGSNGSVIPLFKKQIEKGGPVTITDNRIIRYFMTIAEASSLVISAGAHAKKGELFVLDMGKPVSILSLAKTMIKMAGYEPYKDIDIREIGLRPGEKLYEELLITGESQIKTENSKIFIECDTPLSRSEVDEKIKVLTDALISPDFSVEKIKEAYMKVIPTYKEPEKVNNNLANVKEILDVVH
ncbi:MAG: polysaccharide biosynthesis protein [Oscillospiraceae bacterium]|nr:polysaccharide biosynthesis protein [Oscillospiraceae bacterium]